MTLDNHDMSANVSDRRDTENRPQDARWDVAAAKRWGEHQANRMAFAPRPIKRLILHCSATGPSLDIGGYEIRKWHVEDNGWSDIGYHAIIRRSGLMELGRDWRRSGAHVYGENGDSLGLCLVGGRAASADDHFTDHFTPEQLTALVPLIQTALTFGLTVHGHNEFANKGCPGFRVDGFIQEFVA